MKRRIITPILVLSVVGCAHTEEPLLRSYAPLQGDDGRQHGAADSVVDERQDLTWQRTQRAQPAPEQTAAPVALRSQTIASCTGDLLKKQATASATTSPPR